MADKAYSADSHESYDAIEERFQRAMDDSLAPRGPELLFDLVADLGLPPGARVLDVGCGRGAGAVALAERFGFAVHGVDPGARYAETARAELARAAAAGRPGPGAAVSFGPGLAEDLPAEDRSVDLVWCRDVLVHVEELGRAYAEFRRVLRPGGRALVYQMFATELLEAREAAWLFPVMGCVAANMDPRLTEAAVGDAGLRVDECVVLGAEWGEFAQERSGSVGRHLLHAARLQRDPERYVRQFGRANYEIALGDCLWHVYRMIGKLSGRVYVLSAP